MAGDGSGIAPSFTFLKPFGKHIASGHMLGTNSFPALRLLDKGNVLPLQNDIHSCGVGMVAGIAIILRELLQRSRPEEITAYNEIFSPENMFFEEGMVEDDTEVICNVPE